eukprot:scaffold13842_cov115-Isochrysis_galbana.AAC.8
MALEAPERAGGSDVPDPDRVVSAGRQQMHPVWCEIDGADFAQWRAQRLDAQPGTQVPEPNAGVLATRSHQVACAVEGGGRDGARVPDQRAQMDPGEEIV